MGVNIHAYYLNDDGSNLEHPTWDWYRYSGDTAFAWGHYFEWVVNNSRLHEDGEEFQRPKDIDEAIKFVNSDYVPEMNRPRLIKILNEMKEDETLYLTMEG